MLLAIALFFLYRRSAKTNITYVSNLAAAMDSVDVYKAESGLWAARAGELTVTLAEVEAVKNAEIERLVRELRIKPKEITRLVNVYLEGGDSIVLTPVEVDASTQFEGRYTYRDDWNFFEAWVSEPNIGLTYSVTDSISIVSHTERVGLFKREYKVSAISYNPAIKILGLNSLIIEQPQRKLRIGGFVGPSVGIDGKVNVSVGVGLVW